MAEESEPKKKDLWDIVKVLGVVASTVAVPVVIAVAAHIVNTSFKERDVRLRTVELAIGILKEDPKNSSDETKALRRWAMDVIDAYSGVPLPEGARAALQKAPILRVQAAFECLGGMARLLAGPGDAATVVSHADRCEFSVNGATRETGDAHSCSNVNATAYVPKGRAVSITTSANACSFTVASGS